MGAAIVCGSFEFEIGRKMILTTPWQHPDLWWRPKQSDDNGRVRGRWICYASDSDVRWFTWDATVHEQHRVKPLLACMCRRQVQCVQTDGYQMQYGYKDWQPSQAYYAFAAEVGCNTKRPYGGNETIPIFQCLQNATSERLMNASSTVSQEGTFGTW